MARYSTDLIGSEGVGGDEGEDGWMISYLDVLTLIIALFVLLLAFADHNQPDQGAEADATAPQVMPFVDRSGLLPELTGLNPHYERLQRAVQALELQGVEARLDQEGVTLRLDERLLFESGQAELTEAGHAALEQLQPVLGSVDGEISVEGHTDNVPISTARFPSNWELSSARALSVVHALKDSGADPTRLRAIGYGETRPIEPNDSAAGRASNRRVELVLRQSG